MRHVLNRSGLVVQVAVLGLFVTAVVTFAWAIALTGQFVVELADGGFGDEQLLVKLLGTIDTYLIAVVQLIVAIGLYELFVGDLDVPDWLEVTSLDDLKKSLIDALIVVLAVKGIEKVVSSKDALDGLYSALAIAVLVGAFAYFRSLKSAPKKPVTAAIPPDPSAPAPEPT